MASYTDLVRKLASNVDKYPDAFADAIFKVQQRFLDEIIPLLNGFKLDELGNVLATAENYALSAQISERTGVILAETGYTEAMQKFGAGLVEQRAVTNSLYQNVLSNASLDFIEFNAMYANASKTALNVIGQGAVTTFQTEFATVLNNAISSSSTFNQVINNIRISTVGNADVDGVLYRYAKQNAKDSFAVTNRAYMEQINNEYGIEFFRYAGSNMDTTRPFCLDRAGQVYHRKTIESWASKSWQGKNRATDKSTIFTLLGGYNCNHVLTPVPLDKVPTDVMQDALDNGWIDLEDLPSRIRGKFE